MSQASLIHITSPPINVAQFIAEVARKMNVLVSYDPGGKVVRKGLKQIEPVLHNTDIFLPSKSELGLLYPDMKNSQKIAHNLINEYGIRIVSIKLGAEGCLVISNNEQIQVGGFSVNRIDTTGAGDSFAAAFSVGFQRGWSLSKCAKYANAAGALTVTRIGARTAMPTMDDLEKLIK